MRNNYLKYYKYFCNDAKTYFFYKTSPRYFTCKHMYTETVASTKYKNKVMNNYHSVENAFFQTQYGDKIASFKNNAMLIFIIRQMAHSEQLPVHIIGTMHNHKDIYMPTNYKEFLDMLDMVTALKISFLAGEDAIKFTISTDNLFNIIKVSTSVFHPENLSSETILLQLQSRINDGIRCLDIFEDIEKVIIKEPNLNF